MVAMARAASICATLSVLCLTSPAAADVIELSTDGTVSLRAGAGAAVWDRQDEIVKVTDSGVADPNTFSSAISLSPVAASAVPKRYALLLERAASAANVSPALLAAVVWQESRWNAQAISPKGAIGLAQLMPGTARDLGVDPRDPAQNLIGGARYLRQLLDQFDGDIEKSLAAYNAGPGRVLRSNGVPRIRETQSYVSAIVDRLSHTVSGGI